MFENLLNSIPPVTRAIMICYIIGIGLFATGFVNRYDFYFNLQKIFWEGQVWRLVTCLIHYRKVGFYFAFQMLFFSHMFINLERSVFRRGSIDFLFFILCLCGLLYGLAILFSINYLGIIFKYIIYYIYGRINENVVILLNLIPVRAPFLIWIIFMIQWLLQTPDLKNFFISILIGHSFYFIHVVYPQLHFSSKKKIFDTPQFFIQLVSPMFQEQDRIQRDADAGEEAFM